MTRPIPLCALLLAAFTPSFSWADIILGTVDRHVIVRVTSVNTDHFNSSDGPFSDFVGFGNSDASASAEQNSDIQPLALTGLGSVEVDNSSDADVLAESVFDVFFDLAVPHTFTLTGEIGAGGEGGDPMANFSLTGPSINFLRMVGFDDFEMFMANGTLAPGQYHVVASARMTSGLGGGGFLFDLQLTPQPEVEAVPEPASMAVWGLVAFVACATGWARRSRRA